MMKLLVFASTLFLARVSGAWALDVQPGEWASIREGKSVHFCVTPAIAAQLKKWYLGDQWALNACATRYLENGADKMVFEITCENGLMGQGYRFSEHVEIVKTSDTTFSLTASGAKSDASGPTHKLSRNAAQSFVGPACSAASKTQSVDFING